MQNTYKEKTNLSWLMSTKLTKLYMDCIYTCAETKGKPLITV